LSIKRKKRTHKFSKKSPTYYINIAVILFFLALIAVLAKIFIFDTIPKDEESNKTVAVLSKQTPLTDSSYHKYEEKTKALEIEYVDDESISKVEKGTEKQSEVPEKKFSFFDDKAKVETKTIPEAKQEIETSKPKIEADKVIQKKETEKEKKVIAEKVPKEKYPEVEKEKIKQPIPQQQTIQRESGSAKLVVIIDDVSTKRHIQKIQEIGYPITMAFMPPTKIHKDSAIIAQGLNSYMVHLPLEATSRSAEESDTLHVGDDLATIEKKIKQLKNLYPKAVYYNNHTGSKFTADEQSMDMLMQVLKNNNIQFVDSRTTPKSVVKQYATKYGMRYIGRNVFLDNTPTKKAIKIQLQKAIEIAKKTGSAIAIGHPYNATFEALKESKEMLSGITVVTIDKF
jgi:polysaccharide deacetylase 2 family uncharacterized protein YibQ